MQQYLYRRLLLAVPTILGVTILIFFFMRILPGDPLSQIVGEDTGIYLLTEKELAAARASLGLDKPLVMQYLSWMGDVAKGELGRSFWQARPIRDMVLRRGPITAQIALMAVLVSWVIGLPVGIIGGGVAKYVAGPLYSYCGYAFPGGTQLLAGAHVRSHNGPCMDMAATSYDILSVG